MTDFVWPNGVRMSEVHWRHLSNSEVSPAMFTGTVQTAARVGDRLACTITVANARGAEKAKLRALAAKMRGRANRIYLEDLSMAGRRRGSFSATEMLSNADLSNGTTGYTVIDGAFTVSDGVGRVSAIQGGVRPQIRQQPTLTQYVPYVLRSIINDGQGSSGLSIGPYFADNATATSVSDYSTTRGYRVASMVPGNPGVASGVHPIVFSSQTGFTAGTFVSMPFTSFARCALLDCGANLITRSDEFGHADWAVNNATHTAVVSNNTAAPDGTTTADSIREESTTSAERYVLRAAARTVSSSVLDYAFSVAVKAGTRSWVALRMVEGTSSHNARAWFNLATGALGTANASGSNWTHVRSYITSLGDGWYRCTLVARKASASTAITPLVQATTSDTGTSYAGVVSDAAIHMWRATLSQSGVPTRLVQSTSAAVSASAPTGTQFFVKGLPASTTGLLKVGDQIEIDKQIKFCTHDLNSDASGLGCLLVDSPLVRSTADSTPIIVEKPMAKFYMTRDAEYPARPGDLSDFVFEFEQDLAA